MKPLNLEKDNMIKAFVCGFIFLISFSGCLNPGKTPKDKQIQSLTALDGITLHVLGTVQDGGSPHINCQRKCCKLLFENPDDTRKVVSLGIVDHSSKKTYLFDATPDMTSQLRILSEIAGKSSDGPEGIFLTHAHIGHYTGLMYLGREAFGAKDIPVFAMPKMTAFLRTNGPWNQLVDLKNISLKPLKDKSTIKLSNNLTVLPFLVPHRGEYSETVGFKIIGPNKSALFIPDIDKWSIWETNIIDEIEKVDYAFLDATFYDGEEVNHRDISEIPHPFVIESLELFKDLAPNEKNKIHFIHLNHTNPLLNKSSEAYKSVIGKGFKVAAFKDIFKL
ncbi:MAG: MBL fold metallo-hydrolase [Bacteroidota bacterium]